MTVKTRSGLSAARFAKAIFIGKNNLSAACGYGASQNWTDTPELLLEMRSAVSSMNTSNSDALLRVPGIDFSQFIRPATLIGRIRGMREVPLRVRLINGIGGSTAYWVGEGQSKPISSAAFGRLDLDPLKVVGVAVVTKELLMASNPKADEAVGADLRAAGVAAMDAAFIDPANLGQANIRPASVTATAERLQSSGSTVAQIDADLEAMVERLTAAGSDLSTAFWTMRPTTAVSLALKRGSGGALAYPGMSAKGGELLGLPVLTTPHLTADTSGSFITLVDASEIAIGDDDESRIHVSLEGAVHMADNPPSGASMLVSLYQNNCAAIRVERHVNWKIRREDFAVVLENVQY